MTLEMKSIKNIRGWLEEINKKSMAESPFLLSAVGFALAEIYALEAMVKTAESDEKRKKLGQIILPVF